MQLELTMKRIILNKNLSSPLMISFSLIFGISCLKKKQSHQNNQELRSTELSTDTTPKGSNGDDLTIPWVEIAPDHDQQGVASDLILPKTIESFQDSTILWAARLVRDIPERNLNDYFLLEEASGHYLGRVRRPPYNNPVEIELSYRLLSAKHTKMGTVRFHILPMTKDNHISNAIKDHLSQMGFSFSESALNTQTPLPLEAPVSLPTGLMVPLEEENIEIVYEWQIYSGDSTYIHLTDNILTAIPPESLDPVGIKLILSSHWGENRHLNLFFDYTLYPISWTERQGRFSEMVELLNWDRISGSTETTLTKGSQIDLNGHGIRQIGFDSIQWSLSGANLASINGQNILLIDRQPPYEETTPSVTLTATLNWQSISAQKSFNFFIDKDSSQDFLTRIEQSIDKDYLWTIIKGQNSLNGELLFDIQIHKASEIPILNKLISTGGKLIWEVFETDRITIDADRRIASVRPFIWDESTENREATLRMTVQTEDGHQETLFNYQKYIGEILGWEQTLPNKSDCAKTINTTRGFDFSNLDIESINHPQYDLATFDLLSADIIVSANMEGREEFRASNRPGITTCFWSWSGPVTWTGRYRYDQEERIATIDLFFLEADQITKRWDNDNSCQESFPLSDLEPGILTVEINRDLTSQESSYDYTCTKSRQ